MSGDTRPLSVFVKGAVLLTSAVAGTMLVGGLIYAAITEGFFSWIASLFVSYVGGWAFVNVMVPAKNILIDVGKTVLTVGIKVLRTVIRFLLFKF